MTPRYAGDGWELYVGDCLAVLPGLTGISAVVSDPPYGINHSYHGGGYNHLATRQFERVRIAGNRGRFDPSPILALELPTILWGGNHFADRLPASGGWLVWDKERPDELDQATCELAWTNCIKGVRRYRHLWNGMMRASEHGENYHPTQKPVALYDWIFSLRWVPDGVILDPYCGSGPCGVAAIKTGHKFIGIEIDPHYAAIAAKRLERAEADKRNSLPFPEPEPRPKQVTMWEAV